MDLVTQTSLEALLLKATSSANQNMDTAALEAFCTLVNKEKDGAHIGVKVISNRMHSAVEKEVLQTLNVLDNCMSRCGTHFQAEVGKFRFLNEMIKLVSPKYLGCQTPVVVKQKVLQLLYVWTLDFPKESKIKEAYEMLRKQGVIREIPNPNVAVETNNIPKKKSNSIFQDEEKSKVLQKLLQSKDPEDIQAANWLIKSMVKEDEKRIELKSQRLSELEAAQNNIRLLNEMLDSYIAETTSKDEMDLIKELYQSCERLRTTLAKLASETAQNEDLLGDIIQVNDELSQVFSKYRAIIIGGRTLSDMTPQKSDDADLSLLTFDVMSLGNDSTSTNIGVKDTKTDMTPTIDVLCDLFNASSNTSAEVLKPVQLMTELTEKTENKLKAFDDLDILGQHLMKENLKSDGRRTFSGKYQDKVPMNLLTKKSELRQNSVDSPKDEARTLDFDLNLFIKSPVKQNHNGATDSLRRLSNSESGDDCLVDISDEHIPEGNLKTAIKSKDILKQDEKIPKTKTDLNLKNITVELKDIKPSILPPITILDKNHINVTVHHAKDRPRDEVRVFVVTTVSKNELPLSQFLFQAVVPKSCRLKLQSPSATELPAFNPFLPPSAITQIMIISNPEEVQLTLKYVLSYSLDDETITEMGEIENL
ncbi:hypothetical protein WA026_022570 [Henosepilachna vigintioctopunctata]|uniref:ADP-ribosylation factor-binding protein GGA1 n=1 Tax=Henosepilachna vigintioctopunctata TaxID=420089 RepID=A0AAW1VJJ4_9CUCU